MSESLYDLLGVDSSATEAEIKAAWRSLVTVLGPTDDRFAAINDAASVLLDPGKRAAYDAEQMPQDDSSSEPELQPEESEPAPLLEPQFEVAAPDAPPAQATPAQVTVRPVASRTLPSRITDAFARPVVMLACVLVALCLLATTCVLYLLQDDGVAIADRTATVTLTDASGKPIKADLPTRESADTTAAIVAMVDAAPKVFSYDYRSLPANRSAGLSVLTAEYAAKSFTPYFDGLVAPNAKRVRQSVVCGPVLDVGVVRTAPGLVELLVLLDRFASNKSVSAVSQDFADVTLVKQNDRWLINNIATAPIPKS